MAGAVGCPCNMGMAITLGQFFDRLDQVESRIPLEELMALLGELEFTVDEIDDYAAKIG